MNEDNKVLPLPSLFSGGLAPNDPNDVRIDLGKSPMGVAVAVTCDCNDAVLTITGLMTRFLTLSRCPACNTRHAVALAPGE